MKEKMKTILLIEDNAADAMFIDELLQGSGCACELKRCERLSQAFALADAQSFDAVLLDLGLPDSIGIETLSRLQERMPDVPVVVLTGMSDQEVAASAISLGAQDYLVKGRIEREVLVRSILYSIERKRIETSMREQKDLSEALNRLDSLIHSTLDFDAVLQQLLQQASEAMGVEASSLGLFHNNKYVIKCVHNLSSELVGSPVPIGEMKGVLHTARVRDVVAFNNAQEDGRLNNETYAALGIRSMMIAPFIVKGLMLGAMSFFSLSRIFQFTGTHLDFARRLAASVSSAFDNARLYDALRKSERLSRSRLSQLEAIYASAPVGLCFIDSDLRYVNINERLAEINGLPAEEHVGRTVRDVTPNMADRVEPYLRQALQNGKAVETQDYSLPGSPTNASGSPAFIR
jgi:PAS domain S-box-containing protein